MERCIVKDYYRTNWDKLDHIYYVFVEGIRVGCSFGNFEVHNSFQANRGDEICSPLAGVTTDPLRTTMLVSSAAVFTMAHIVVDPRFIHEVDLMSGELGNSACVVQPLLPC